MAHIPTYHGDYEVIAGSTFQILSGVWIRLKGRTFKIALRV